MNTIIYIALGILAVPVFAIFLGILSYLAVLIWYAFITDIKGD